MSDRTPTLPQSGVHGVRRRQHAVHAAHEVGHFFGRHAGIVRATGHVALGGADHRHALPWDRETEAPIIGMLEGHGMLGQARIDDVDALDEAQQRSSVEAHAGQGRVRPRAGGVDRPLRP